MIIIYNANGTVDLCATREAREGNLTEADMEDMLEEAPETERAPSSYPKSAAEEFWSDPCWGQPPGFLG